MVAKKNFQLLTAGLGLLNPYIFEIPRLQVTFFPWRICKLPFPVLGTGILKPARALILLDITTPGGGILPGWKLQFQSQIRYSRPLKSMRNVCASRVVSFFLKRWLNIWRDTHQMKSPGCWTKHLKQWAIWKTLSYGKRLTVSLDEANGRNSSRRSMVGRFVGAIRVRGFGVLYLWYKEIHLMRAGYPQLCAFHWLVI